MITVLLGTDQFAKKTYIKQATAQIEAGLQVVRSGDSLPDLRTLSGATLFGAASVYIFDRCGDQLDYASLLAHTSDNSLQIYIIEDAIDKRKSINQQLLKDARVTVIDYSAPQGDAAVRWIIDHARQHNITITESAARALYTALVPDEKLLPVLTTHNELQKLNSFANGAEITEEMVSLLTKAGEYIDIFELLNKIAMKDKAGALQMMDTFFALGTGDEKTKAIQLSALFADQLRNILLVTQAASENISDTELLTTTGWKSGRLFILKKFARAFTSPGIRATLAKLENLDMELKTSTMPAQVILDVIITGM